MLGHVMPYEIENFWWKSWLLQTWGDGFGMFFMIFLSCLALVLDGFGDVKNG
jgi:hypothetical protein